MSKHFALLAGLCLVSIGLNAQSAFAPLHSEYNWLLDRYEIKSGAQALEFETAVKPYQRHRVVSFMEKLKLDSASISRADRFNINYLLQDSWEWASDSTPYMSTKPFLKHFFDSKSDFFHKRTKEFSLHTSPVVYSQFMDDPSANRRPYVFGRGIEFRAHLEEKVGVYFYVVEQNYLIPNYIVEEMGKNNRTGGKRPVPGEGFYKSEKQDYASFYSARGYFSFNATKFINFQFGHDRNFVGNGYRSLILSDFAPAYLFLKINTRYWKINYTNTFAKMTAKAEKFGDAYPSKFLALHRLGINIGKNLNIGISEMVVFSRQDSLGNNRFELDYLNPMIFYRFTEHHLGDPDNVMLASDFKWNLARRFQIYGQFVLDELKSASFFGRDGWWGNKQALQLGLKYIDVLKIKNLDLQAEFNAVRPFMYAHYNQPEFSNYQHYQQPLAHPSQSNFYEILGILRYQPFGRLNVLAKAFWIQKGESEYRGRNLVRNWGGSLFDDYTLSKAQEYGNYIGQGVRNEILMLSLVGSYQIYQNLFLELGVFQRNATNRSDRIISFGFRWNAAFRANEF
jgi:hypothetical protein